MTQRTTTTVLAAVLVIGALAAVPVAIAQQTATDRTNQTNGTATVSPGEQLSGVVGVGEAELSGEVESRAYGVRIANANSSEAKAAIVAEQVNESEQRIAEIERQRTALEAARENGSLSEGQYRARMATLHAESQSGARLVNQTSETASTLPAETLEANGVNVSAIQTLRDRAANLTGPETAEIAKRIAGENAGQPARPEEATTRSEAGARAGSGGDRGGADDGADAPTATNETTDGSGSRSDSGSTTDSTGGSDSGSSAAAGRDGSN